MSDFPEIKIPFWMNGPHVRTLAGASRVWFGRLGEWAAFPLRQADPMTCSERMLDLIAWQRGVPRAAGEAERLYRLRVAHAYANARDSGQIAGWKRIFKRLELGDIALEERKAGQDWDVIGIMMDDGSFPSSSSPTTGGHAGDTISFPGFRKGSRCGSSPLMTITLRSAPGATRF